MQLIRVITFHLIQKTQSILLVFKLLSTSQLDLMEEWTPRRYLMNLKSEWTIYSDETKPKGLVSVTYLVK